MIQICDLSMSHGDQVLFTNVSFTINTGEKCGLVGRNGTGKSTLLRLITNQEKPDCGTIRIPKGYRLGYLDQHIRFTCKTALEEALLGLKESERDLLYKAEKMLFGLGFDEEQLAKPLSMLSGGFHLRLHLAKVLLSEPNCLLLDEPTNYLDILSMRFLSRFLQKWTGELIIVSHDREFMDEVSTHTLGIHRNQIRKVKGKTADLFGPILLEEESYEKTRENLEKRKAHMQSFVERLGAKASKAAQAQSRKKMLEKIPALEALKAIEDLDFVFHELPFQGKKVGEAKEVSFSYSDNLNPLEPFAKLETALYEVPAPERVGRVSSSAKGSLIKKLSLTIGKGDRIAIIGKNGYGKSTILRLLAQELSPTEGSIIYSDQVSIGYFGQTNIQRLNENLPIEAEIFASNPTLSSTEIRRICAQMMFRGKQADKKINVLSGGEKSRVLLGKIIAKPCNLLLLDEPTHHLDVESVEALIDALEEFSGAVVIVTHSELILERLSLSTLVVCHENRQEIYMGGYEGFLEKVGWQEEKTPGNTKEKSISRSEEKRLRAEMIAARSKALKPIKDEMDGLESAIISLENAQKNDQKALEDLITEGSSGKIQNLMISMGKRTKEIDQHFSQLLELGDQYEATKKTFDLDV